MRQVPAIRLVVRWWQTIQNVGASNTRVGFDGAVFPGTDPINGGDPNPIYNDASDGSRNDAGCFGGDGSLIKCISLLLSVLFAVGHFNGKWFNN